MNRRNFIRLSALTSAASLAIPATVFAQDKTVSNTLAGKLYYTKEHPGRWHKKIGGHLPTIQISEWKDKSKVKVTTAHEMNAYGHYITKHILLDQDFNFIDEKIFDPAKDQVAVSEFELGHYKGLLHVLSVCNKHDTWLNSTEI